MTKHHTSEQHGKNIKDEYYAKLAFVLSLFFWFPLFNVGLCIVSLYFARLQWNQIRTHPKRYGGLGYIVTAGVLCLTGLIMTVIGVVIYILERVYGVRVFTT